MIRHDLGHIVVLVTDCHIHRTRAVFLIQVLCDRANRFLARLEPCTVMISDDVLKPCLFNISLHPVKMIEALISFRVLRCLGRRQHRGKFHRDQACIFHLIFRTARVNILPMDLHTRFCRVEALIFDNAEGPAVNGIRLFRSETLRVKMLCAASGLLIRCKSNAYGTVRLLRMVVKILHKVHDLRDTSLVICPEQCRPV